MDKEEAIHVYNGILSYHKKNKILPLVTMCIDIEGTMLSEVRQRKTNTLCCHLFVESKKITNECI